MFLFISAFLSDCVLFSTGKLNTNLTNVDLPPVWIRGSVILFFRLLCVCKRLHLHPDTTLTRTKKFSSAENLGSFIRFSLPRDFRDAADSYLMHSWDGR